MNILIDTTGTVWDEQSGNLRMHFHAPISSKALPDYLVRNMGFIGLKISRDSVLIRGTPALISYAAFGVASEFIEDANPRRLALQWFDGGWHDETYFGADITRAKRHLLNLMFKQRRRGRQYLSYPRELGSISLNHPHSKLLAYWNDNGGKIDPVVDHETIYNITDGKFLAVDAIDGQQLRFSTIGTGLTVYRDNSWAKQYSGGTVENQPDYNYGCWVAEGYREAFAHRQPGVSDYDAIVHDTRNGNVQHHRYTRLILPIQTRSGALQLLSAPRGDSSIDLSFKIGAKAG